MARLAGVGELNCEPTDHCRGCANLGRGRGGSYGRAALATRPIAVAMTAEPLPAALDSRGPLPCVLHREGSEPPPCGQLVS